MSLTHASAEPSWLRAAAAFEAAHLWAHHVLPAGVPTPQETM
jgi:hypothetical protein